MRSLTGIARRLAVMGVVVIGLMGLAVNPAVAREICNENETLGIADANGDGVVSRGEIQAIIDAAQGVEGVDQLQSLLDGLPGDVTGIRYQDCAGSGDGSGTGDDGDGSGTGTDGGNGTGTDGGSGTDDGTGTGTSDAGTGDDGTAVLNDQGTPVDPITGLPDTGQMPGSQAPGTVSAWLLLSIVGAIAGAGALVLRARARAS